jgi:hypothetical protein
MGLVCREEIVFLEIRPVFFNIMFLDDTRPLFSFHSSHHYFPPSDSDIDTKFVLF